MYPVEGDNGHPESRHSSASIRQQRYDKSVAARYADSILAFFRCVVGALAGDSSLASLYR